MGRVAELELKEVRVDDEEDERLSARMDSARLSHVRRGLKHRAVAGVKRISTSTWRCLCCFRCKSEYVDAPEAAAYRVFRPNTFDPRHELLGVSGDIFSFRSVWTEMLLDLKELLFFTVAFVVWVGERLDDFDDEERETRVQSWQLAWIAIGLALFMVLLTVASYIEFARRRRMYYAYLCVDILVDFENLPPYRKARWLLGLLATVIMFWTGLRETEPVSYHNFDGLIAMVGALYFLDQTLDTEHGLVPFSKLFERPRTRALIQQGWSQLEYVSETQMQLYLLKRAQQVREYSSDRKLPKNYTRWQVSRDDLMDFLVTDLRVRLQEGKMRRKDFARGGYPEAAARINGFWWRRHWYGTVIGWLVVERTCVYGPYDRTPLSRQDARSTFQVRPSRLPRDYDKAVAVVERHRAADEAAQADAERRENAARSRRRAGSTAEEKRAGDEHAIDVEGGGDGSDDDDAAPPASAGEAQAQLDLRWGGGGASRGRSRSPDKKTKKKKKKAAAGGAAGKKKKKRSKTPAGKKPRTKSSAGSRTSSSADSTGSRPARSKSAAASRRRW